MSQIYLPTLAVFPSDIGRRLKFLQPLIQRKFQVGLMLVLRGPQDLTKEAIDKQITNLLTSPSISGYQRSSIIIMHPNKPIEGSQRLNFLDNLEWSVKYVKKSIDLASNIAKNLKLKNRICVTFHLNSLLKPAKVSRFDSGSFQSILINLKKLFDYANSQKINLAIENTPIPEFGDIERNDKSLLRDGKTYLSDLINPYPLLLWSKQVKEIRNIGIHLVIDTCHTFLAINSLKKSDKLPKNILDKLMIDKKDITKALTIIDIAELILSYTKDGDIWHLNDFKKFYQARPINNEYQYFEEGIALFAGEIPQHQMKNLIKNGMKKNIKIVLEVNEDDYFLSPNTKQTISSIISNIN